MPSGKTHTKATVTLATVSAAVCVLYGLSQWHTVGIVTGLLLHPDLDVDRGCITNKHIRKISPKLERVWAWYWKPYGIIAKHRSPVSHSYGISTLIRTGYAMWWLLFIPESVLYYEWFFGLAAADALHITMDLIMEIYQGLRELMRRIK